MYEFKYTKENGYLQVQVSKKDHNTIFKYRQIKWYQKYEYFLNKERGHFVMIRLTSLAGKLVNILCYPVIILLHGLANYKEVNQEISDQWNEKERGKFVIDDLYKDQEGWDKLTRVVKELMEE